VLLPVVRDKLRKMSEEYIDAVNNVISGYDRDLNPSVKGDGKRRAGLGIYYFE
jgi:hypothetical protein